MQLGFADAFICYFPSKHFHTLKIELDFYSRQGECFFFKQVYSPKRLFGKMDARLFAFFGGP